MRIRKRGNDDNQPDLDENGEPDPWLHSLYDCNWRNQSPDWGAPGELNDPSEDIDDTDGFGPENVNLESPEEGLLYKVGVRFFNDNFSEEVTTATVKIYQGGVLLEEMSQRLERYDMWEVAWVGRDGAIPISGNGQPVVIPGYNPNGF